MSDQVVINYSLGSSTRRKRQEALHKATVVSKPVGIKLEPEYKPLTKKFIDMSVDSGGLPIIPMLAKGLETVFDLQDFMVDNFDKYKS